MPKELKMYLDHNDNREVCPAILWDAGKIRAKSAWLKRIEAKTLSDLQEQLKNFEHLIALTRTPLHLNR